MGRWGPEPVLGMGKFQCPRGHEREEEEKREFTSGHKRSLDAEYMTATKIYL